MRYSFVIPAHDVEAAIEGTLLSLRSIDYPSSLFDTVVVADNCSDRTADVAAASGATVYRRHDLSRPGKGHALAWAFERLQADRPGNDAFVLVDADCRASQNLLGAIESRLVDGARAVQVSYVVSNPESSWRSGLRSLAFAYTNTALPLGKSTLGLSAGLLGTGMAFSRLLLEECPWRAFSLTEDLEYHLQLVDRGERVVFAHEASVASAMPTFAEHAFTQELRWATGRWHALRTWVPRLARSGFANRDAARLTAALELLLPPQSLLLASNILTLGFAVGLRSRLAGRVAVANLAGQAGSIVAAAIIAKSPPRVYRTLLFAPIMAAEQLRLHLRVLAGRGARAWVRTEREPHQNDSA
jgi:cellulose synthase/poly-beta-1,6-N-acetylglucosamine synthase-like glycosyltransferase